MTQGVVWIAAAALGAVGAAARFRLDGAISRRVHGDLPWGTWAINTIAALSAGLLAGAGVVGTTKTLLAVGALGSFSTFSTWILETQRLAEDGRAVLAGVNVAIGLAGGLLAVILGWMLGVAM